MKKHIVLHSGRKVNPEAVSASEEQAKHDAAVLEALNTAADKAEAEAEADEEATEMAEEACGYSAAVSEYNSGRVVTSGEGTVEVQFPVRRIDPDA